MCEEDVTDWAKAQLQAHLGGRVLYSDQEVVIRTADVYSNGKATLKLRDHPTVTLEFVVLVAWDLEGKGRSIHGQTTIANLSEKHLDAPQLESTLPEGGAKDPAAIQVLTVMRTKGRMQILTLLDAFWDHVRLRFGPRCLIPPGDAAAERREVARCLTAWMMANTTGPLRLAWLSNKALLARTLVTGLVTAGGACLIGGPAGLATVGAVVGGGCGGYKGWQLQRENFADFVQAFFDTDRVLLVDMMVKFLVTPAGQPVTLDRWEEWVVDPAHQRLLLVHYCKELSDDSDSSTSAAPSACSEHTTSNKVLTKMRRCCPFGLPRAPSAPAPPPAPHGPS